jgi:hypothetical protein
MRQTTFRTKLIAFIGALMLFGGALAYARPQNEVEKIYYAGPDKQVEVGGSLLTCQGNFFRWGRTTSWYERFVTPCD